MAPILSKQDSDVQAALSAIENHISTMRSAIAQADSIKSSVGTNFILPAGVAFQNQIQNWEESAQQVITMFVNLQSDLQTQSQILNSSNDDANSTAHGWNTSIGGSTYAALTP